MCEYVALCKPVVRTGVCDGSFCHMAFQKVVVNTALGMRLVQERAGAA